MGEKKEKPIAAFFSIVFMLLLIIGSAGWLISNIDESWGWIFEWIFDSEDPVPTETAIPDNGVDAVLYAECQEQLKDALEGLGPIPTDEDKEGNAEYLDEAQKAYVRMRDLVYRGRFMFDELDARTKTEEEYRVEWMRRTQDFRVDLYASVEKYRDLGVGDQFVRIHSELFLAYQWLDRFSDQINGFFSSQQFESISDQGLNRAEAHLDTARDLLNR